MTSQPDHSLADEPMVDEPLPDESRPSAIVTPEPLPAEPLPEEAVSHPRPTFDSGPVAATVGGRFGNDLPEPVVIGRHTDLADDTQPDTTELAGDTDLDMRTTAAAVAPGRLTGQWHDIQAMFVDDPQGSVQRAAQVTDAAIAALAESLRRRRAALVPGDTSIPVSNTEQLREALVEFRAFYERLAALAEQLPAG